MDLEHLQSHWDEWGRRDPIWAILSDHGDRSVEDFFARGREEVAERMAWLRARGIDLRARRALDFGCGMGRLTQAFCDHFAECDGIDIAPSMIELARRHNRHGDRCRYHLNAGGDLSRFADQSFDLVYTALVLQHMRPRYAAGYVRELLRLVAPGGVAIFQVTGEVIAAGDGVAPFRDGTSPLRDEARRAEIELLNLPARRPAGLQFALRLAVRNVGRTAWPAARTPDGTAQLVVVNRWLDASGEVVEAEDGRALLPHDLEPSATAELSLIIAAPQRPGHYLLEVDVLEEGIGRFGERAGTAATARLDVVPVPIGAIKPAIQMFGMGRQAVARLVAGSGLRLVEVNENSSGGPHWTSALYCARRSADPTAV